MTPAGREAGGEHPGAQEAAHRKGLVADHLRLEAMPGPPGEEAAPGITLEELPADPRGLAANRDAKVGYRPLATL